MRIKSAYVGHTRIPSRSGFHLENIGGVWHTRNNEECTSIKGVLTQKKFVISDGEFSVLKSANTAGLLFGSCTYGSICKEHTNLLLPVATETWAFLYRADAPGPISLSVYAPVSVQASVMFAEMRQLNKLHDFYLPLATNVDSMLRMTGLPEFDFPLPSASIISNLFRSCGKIERVGTCFSKATNADAAFISTPMLKHVNPSFGSLTTGVDMFKDSGLEADAINAVLDSLPAYTSGDHTITFTGCPGTGACEPSIATQKGWTVQL